MKLLVLAQIPPPLHGQSIMVKTLVEGLPARGVELHHVNLRLSRDAADIGGWRPGKLLAVLDACWHAVAARLLHGCDTLYYVPAPGKRGALYRDWAVMLLVRPFFKKLVLHFHNGGLGDWLATRATPPERWISRLLLGRADLAIILGENLRADAAALGAQSIAIVPNGIADPCADTTPPPLPPVGAGPFEVLFLGLCTEEKGLFAAAEAVLAANAQAGAPAFRLTAAGPFVTASERARFAALSAAHPDTLQHAGFAAGEAKRLLFARSHCLCLPTRYAHEAQPLVVLEALAHDRPVIASRWRALPEMVPPACGRLVPPGDGAALTAALLGLHDAPPAPGLCRAHFLAHGTEASHLDTLAAALRPVGC